MRSSYRLGQKLTVTEFCAQTASDERQKRAHLISEGLDAGAFASITGFDIRNRTLGARTIHRILVAHGLLEPQPHKRPRNSFRRFEKSRANECWQMDGHDRSLADGKKGREWATPDRWLQARPTAAS